MHGQIQKDFVSGGPTSTGFFLFFFLLVDEGRDDPHLKADHHLPTSKTPFQSWSWKFSALNQFLKKTYVLNIKLK